MAAFILLTAMSIPGLWGAVLLNWIGPLSNITLAIQKAKKRLAMIMSGIRNNKIDVVLG
jgi:uncharacterized membrane protein